MKKLEAFFGVQLFIRGRRGVEVTEKGAVLYAYSNGVLSLMEQTEQAIKKSNAA